MSDNQTPEIVRPTKKQTELLKFIESFIQEHGYSPSYREVMNGLNYTSVATVALHINSLIKRGHLRKRDHSARSLEVVTQNQGPLKVTSNQVTPAEEKWLVEKVEHMMSQLEQTAEADLENGIEQISIMLQALKVLGLEGAAQSFVPRLSALKK
jgi:SOS-response transcriptional repressor LexA